MNTPAIPITWADLVRIKKAAKAATGALAQLSHAQRLDALAVSEFGARHFHELQKRYEAHVASHVELAGAHHCRFCHLNFSDFDAGDRKLHRERHQLFEEAQLSLGFLPLPYKEREEMKREFGYDQLRSGDPVTRRMGALAIILSHYDRSLERAIQNGRWHKHPSLLEYLPCAVATSTFLTGNVREQLVNEFGEQPGVIAEGDTDWPAELQRKAGSNSGEALASKNLRESILSAHRASKSAGAATPV